MALSDVFLSPLGLAAAALAVPVVLVAMFSLPIPVRESLVFRYSDPSIVTASTGVESIWLVRLSGSSTSAAHSLAIVVGLFISAYTGSNVSLPLDRLLRDVRITSW
jgi:hypothetical protein